jgi:hypothetical protein
MSTTEPKKRGRKKKIVEESKEMNEPNTDEPKEVEAPKKRGRKPKGGKIVPIVKSVDQTIEKSKNIILHLKCTMSDLVNDNNENNEINNDINNVVAFENTNYSNFLDSTNVEFNMPNNEVINNLMQNQISVHQNDDVNKEHVLEKINELKINLSKNNISDKRSACFWCTYEFHNPPIFIPKREKNDGYEVYGCFCTPECGVAYLMNENMDSSIKFERYQMMNYIYCKSLQYESNIKPAPDPYYLLDKFYGNLSIEEYRSTLRNNNYLIFVEKPLTHVFPEMFIDNNDFTLMKDNSSLNNSLSQYKIKKASTNNKKPKTKSEIVKEKFGIAT